MIFQISITQVVRNVRSWQTSELIASCWGCQQTQLNLDNWLICFPTLRQPKTMSVFGEETKTSSNDLIVHFYHHPYLFVSEKKKQNKTSVNFQWALPCRSCFFREPAGHGSKFHAAAVYAMLDGLGARFRTPKPNVNVKLLNCQPIQLEKHAAKLDSVKNSTSHLYQWTKPKKSVGDASIGSVFHWQNITSRVRTINRNVMASWTDATVVARLLHYRRRVQNGALNINEFQLMRSRVLFKPWIRLKKWQLLHKLIWSIFNRFLPISCPKLQYLLWASVKTSILVKTRCM